MFDDACDCEDLLSGDESLWRARMFEIKTLLEGMKNGREKILLYYHYIRGESIEYVADMMGISRRTGYRVHSKGLLSFLTLYEKKKRAESAFLE